ncbi:MAG: hypothetical protein ACXACX_02590 [Candidatus Hodarchaeales archaeon]|jgi:hypothetical protein
MEIGWKPKAGLNYKIIDWEDENGEYLNSEALGTAWFMDQGQEISKGPGILDNDYSVSRMFTRPETWSYLDPETGEIGQYSSYYYDYRISDDYGLVTFNISLNDDYIADHHRIFDESMFSSGSITFDSLDDYRLYVRVFHAPVYDVGHMAFENSTELYCSQGNTVFDMSRISEFEGVDYSDSTFYAGSYGEGLITLYPEDLMFGASNLLVYQLSSELNDSFSFEVETIAADVVPDASIMTQDNLLQSFENNRLIPEYTNHSYLTYGMPVMVQITDYSGESPFIEGNIEFVSYVDHSGIASFNISDYYLQQLDPGVYQINIYNSPRAYTKDVYRFITLEVRPENWLKFGEPTMELDLLNWYDSGWGGAYFGDDYAFYEDIYPRLTGYLATAHDDDGLSDYVNFKVSAKVRDIGSATAWDDISWIDIGDEDIYVSSLVYDGLYYFEYPFGQDGEMLMGKEAILNISVNANYNKSGIIEEQRTQKLHVLNLTLVSSSIRNDSQVFRKYSDSDTGDLQIGDLGEAYGVERYFDYDTEINTYGIDAEDVLLNLNGYVDSSIEIVEVRGIWEYDEFTLIKGTDYDYTVGDNTLTILPAANMDNHSDLIISYTIDVNKDKVLSWAFSETDGFEFSEIILNTDNNPLQLAHELAHDTYLGTYYSKFNETYTLDASGIADFDIGFSGIALDDIKIYNISKDGQELPDSYILTEHTNGKQITITIGTQLSQTVVIEYGISSYKLDRGYQRIGLNMTEAVRKLSKLHTAHVLKNYSISESDVNLLTIPDDPQDPLEAGESKILIPLIEGNKTSISFNYLALLYDSILNGSFYLDDCVLTNVNKLKPVLATFTFTTEDGESYFDYVTIDPSAKNNKYDFEINLQPMYAVKGYTTYDIEIDFLSYGNNPHTMQYIILKNFTLTADDRILQTVDKPPMTKQGELDVSKAINTGQYMQIFTGRLDTVYDILDDSWLTLAVEGFDQYGDLVKLYRDANDILTFETQEDNSFYFQSLASSDRRLVDSMGLHLNAYNLELPEYIEGEINLYAGKGTNTYGEVYVDDKEFDMNWDSTGFNDYEVDVDTFNAYDYNSQNFLMSTFPLTGQYMLVEGELYLHHKIDISDSNNIITSGLPANVDFAVVVPNETSRISSLSVKSIDRVSAPWDWVESWQGFALTEDDYGQLFNPDNADTYNLPASQLLLTPGVDYELVINAEGRDQINFFLTTTEVRTLLLNDEIQIDFHIDYEFSESDYTIDEDSNTYNAKLHWIFPDASYLNWDQFEYHPDITSTATFNTSFYRMSEFTSMDDFKATVIEDFQFYPNEFNFTEFTFTGFDDSVYEVTLNLTYGGDFQDRWSDVKAFGMTVQTASGERYLNDEYIRNWQHSTLPEHTNEPIFTFDMFKDFFDPLELLNDTEVLLTYYYTKESLSYYSQYDDILTGASNTFIIRDSQQNIISNIGNLESVVGNNITFTEAMKSQLSIGENFTIEMEVKTKGGLLDTKHVFYEVQPYEMRFYNNYYPFSGGSIIAPLYYNISANYQYQLALNYRLQEKSILTISAEIGTTELADGRVIVDLDDTDIDPATQDGLPALVVYYINSSGLKEIITDEYVTYENSENKVTVEYMSYQQTKPGGITFEDTLKFGDTVYISIFPEYNNKYQTFHNFITDLADNEITLLNWTTTQDPANNLIANFESTNFIYDVDPYEDIEKGKVKQVYAILNETNILTYYLTEDLNDATDGWKDYDTLIMKMGFLNPDVLEYINVSFYYDNAGVEQFIGYTNVTLDMFDDDSGAVYIRLPTSSDFQYFTVANNAHINFTAMFYEHTDYQGFFYTNGLPTYQTVEWEADDIVNPTGFIADQFLPIDLDREIINSIQKVYVFNDQFEFLYETIVESRTQQETYNGQTYTLTFDNISLPVEFQDTSANTIRMEDGDLLFLKYNASLEKSIGITVEDMVIQKAPYIEDHDTGLFDVPIAEISLLGINNDGETYTTDDLFDNRDKLVAWETPLDLTPFENEFYNTYKQLVINISFADIGADFKVSDSDNIDHSYITDILVTSNDPRYELIIDSMFLFEFDENATLYDSDIFDIYPNNHLEEFYVGTYTDIYSETIVLDASSSLPLYQSDPNINETHYFDAFDNYGNWYYFTDHLDGEETSTGIYDITWNPKYNKEYYYAYTHPEELPCDVDELYEYYNPHIDEYRYLYISWADTDAWKEWQTIEQINVNTSTLDIVFEYYDDATEEYTSVHYNQTLNEFETQQIAVETIYPYASDMETDIFDLSQNYSNALGLVVMDAKAYFFDESSIDIDPGNVVMQPDKKSVEITSPNGFKLDEFERIVIYFSFDEGVYSDYTRFRLLQAAINNNPGAPAWTKNDSLYVDYEYNDIDYFLLIEEYSVGSEGSLFEYLNYLQNKNFIDVNGLNEMIVSKSAQTEDFMNFTKTDDKRTVLEFHDSDMNGEHELVIEKEDIDMNGLYDLFRYGEIDSAGKIAFHTTLIKIETFNVESSETGDVRTGKEYKTKTETEGGRTILAVRKVITNNTITRKERISTVLIQKDFDMDGIIDKEVSFETINTFSHMITFTTEITDLSYDRADHLVWNIGNKREIINIGSLVEYRNSTLGTSEKSHTFTFREFDNGEVNSTRMYQDEFPNELSEMYNLDNYLETVYNDNGDTDPTNDLVLQAPALESVLTLSHARDSVPAVFDSVITIESPAVIENILSTTKTISIPDVDTGGFKVSSPLDVIEVVPSSGEVIYDSNPGHGPDEIAIDGKYYYYSSSQTGKHDTIFVVDSGDNVVAIVLDYDYNAFAEPNKKMFVEKHIMGSDEVDWPSSQPDLINKIMSDPLIYLGDYDSYDGMSLEPTFTDSLYDIWKMDINSERSSQLMEEVKSITSNQFIQSVKGRVVEDIIWQVAAQVISGIVGLVTQTGTIGYMLTYGLLNAIRAFDQDKQERRHIKAMTLYNDNYEGEITLSDKKAADNLWGGTLTNLIGGSTAGVYAPVYTETEKHLFKGQVMLAPKGVRKTRQGGIENVPISLDYASQTRGYLSYSDFGDQRLVDYFFTDGPLGTSIPKDDDYSHMLNSITFVEDAMSQNTNGGYNTIFPYIQYGQSTFTPTLQVAGPDTRHPTPEFYRDYPIFIDDEYYSGTELENEFHTIFKIYEAKHNGISIIPVNTDNDFNKTSAKVDHIDIYLLDSEGLKVFIGTFYLDSGDYTYREDYNIIYLSDTLFEALQLTLEVLNDKYSSISDYDAYYIIEVKIEKYRSTKNLQGGLTQDEVDRIATMQAVEQSILEYTYQYQHSVDQQRGLSEMFYTIFVTSISTIVTIPFSMGLGALSKSLSKEVAETASEAGAQVATQAATSATTSLATKIALTSLKMSGFFIYSAAKESLQEILLDPFIETIVADVVADVGGNVFAQVLISSLAEGAREGISGPISTLLYGKSQTNTQSYFQTKQTVQEIQASAQDSITDKIQEKSSFLSVRPQWGKIFSTGASVLLTASLVGFGGPMFFGPSLVTGFSAIKSFSKSFIQKNIVHNIIFQEILDVLRKENLDITKKAQISSITEDVITGYIDEQGIYHLPDSETGVSPTVGQCCGAAIGPDPDILRAIRAIATAHRRFYGSKQTYRRLEPYPLKRILSSFLKVFTEEEAVILSNIPVHLKKKLYLDSDNQFHKYKGNMLMDDLYTILKTGSNRFYKRFNVKANRFITYYKLSNAATFFRARANSIKSKMNFAMLSTALDGYIDDIGIDMKFKYKIFEIFNKYTNRRDYISWKEIANLITGTNMFDKGPSVTKPQIFAVIDKLINIFLLDSNQKRFADLGIPSSRINDIKKECYVETLNVLGRTTTDAQVFSQKNFDLIFNVLLAKNFKDNKGKPKYPISKIFGIQELSEQISPTSNRRYLSSTIRRNRDTTIPLSILMDLALWIKDNKLDDSNSRLKRFFDKLQLETPQNSINQYLLKYRPYAVGDYHDYFLDELKIPQQKELLDISLGLDVLLGIFYLNKEAIGISRHHAERDKPYYCIFSVDENTGEWRVKLVPLMYTRHIGMHNSIHQNQNYHSYHFQNDLAIERFTHLVELVLKRKYQKGINFEDVFMKEFREREGTVAGNKIKIWREFLESKPGLLEKWIERWIDKKSGNMDEKDWYTKYYGKFYENRYLPYMDNLALYLLGDNKCNNPDFWRWYLKTYVHEDKYP